MKFALVNPHWEFNGSTYFGCKEPHYPLELLFSFDRIREAGHEPLLLDAHMEKLSLDEVKRRVDGFEPDFLVIPTAPSYAFWRCPQLELRLPREWFAALGEKSVRVAIGPHPSATPGATLRKLDCDVAMRGEPDCTLAELASKPWSQIEGCCWRDHNGEHISAGLAVADIKRLGALDFSNYVVEKHEHCHHFNGPGRGAELEFARGNPWECGLCNKMPFHSKFREREIQAVLQEIDRLAGRGVDYIYFIDETFGVTTRVLSLLEGIAERKVRIGLRTRIDLWNEDTLELLGRARCVSLECGVESTTADGRDELNPNCRIPAERVTELLIYARQRIPRVRANLTPAEHHDAAETRKWQEKLKAHGVWVSEPVPRFPFPGTPLYEQMFGTADDQAWERAHHYYTSTFTLQGYSDMQRRPAAIEEVECAS